MLLAQSNLTRISILCLEKRWGMIRVDKRQITQEKVLYCIVLCCGRVPAANGPGCTAAEGLLYKPWSLVVPTCTARCLHQRP